MHAIRNVSAISMVSCYENSDTAAELVVERDVEDVFEEELI